MFLKISATLNSTGSKSIFLHLGDALHGDMGVIGREDVVICVSKSGESDEIISLSILKSYFPSFCIDVMISCGFVSENTFTNLPICCFAFGPIFFLSNSNVGFTGNPNSFNSNNCSKPLSFSVSTILNFSTLSCDFNKFDNDSNFIF